MAFPVSLREYSIHEHHRILLHSWVFTFWVKKWSRELQRICDNKKIYYNEKNLEKNENKIGLPAAKVFTSLQTPLSASLLFVLVLLPLQLRTFYWIESAKYHNSVPANWYSHVISLLGNKGNHPFKCHPNGLFQIFSHSQTSGELSFRNRQPVHRLGQIIKHKFPGLPSLLNADLLSFTHFLLQKCEDISCLPR